MIFVRVSHTTLQRRPPTQKLLELIQAGDTHVILGLERRVKAHKASNDVAAQEFKKDDAAVAEEVKKMAEAVAGGAVGASGDKADEAEAPNSPRDEEESDGYTPCKSVNGVVS